MHLLLTPEIIYVTLTQPKRPILSKEAAIFPLSLAVLGDS